MRGAEVHDYDNNLEERLDDSIINHVQYINTFTAIVDLSRSNFSIARAPLFQLKSAT